jgi:cytosine/adenosine deaminase-related metal-dependent hydrolase
MSLLLRNCLYIDPKTFEFIPCHIFTEEGPAGKTIFYPLQSTHIPPALTTIDCHRKLVMPSFACGHHHAYSALATGMHPPKKNPVNFEETLKYIWWTLDVCLDAKMIEASALAIAIACAKNGVTFVIDHHSSPSHIKDSLEIIAKAFDQVGISHLLCYEITDRNGNKATEQALEETDGYLAKHQGLVGLHASFTVSDHTLQKAAGLVEKHKSGIHIHVAEDMIDENDCNQKYGKTVVRRLSDFGLLDSPKTILSHCLHINDAERQIIHDSNVWIAQNTESNLNNKVGFFNSKMIENNVMLGTDGMHSDMLKSAKAAYFVGQNFDNIDFAETWRRFRNVNRYIDVNRFEGDHENNLVVLDYNPPTEINSSNFLSHFIFALEAKHIQHVVSNGKLIVKDKKVLTMNEDEIMEQCRKLSGRIWENMRDRTR